MKLFKFLIISSVFLFSSIFAQESKKTVLHSDLENLNASKMIVTNIKSADALDSKIDPILKQLVLEVESGKKSSAEIFRKYNSDSRILAVEKSESDDVTVGVFIKTTNVSSTKFWLESESIPTRTIVDNNIIVASIPAVKIYELAERNEVEYIEGSKISKPMLDISSVEVGANQVHAGSGLPQPYKGANVVVGVVDSGIDWEHEDFDNGSGSRIKFLWDMSGTGNPPSGYSYGTEYTKAQIDLNQCNEIDGDDGGGHGTHVSATAAGKDNAAAGYTGMAPEADIVFVKGFRTGPGFADTDVIDGCNYIFQKAQAMGKPAVINLSLGGHFGPHDGSSLYEQALSGLTGAGKIIVAAAGNEGSDQIHLSYATGGSDVNTARQTFWVINQGVSFSAVDMWYPSGNISVGIAAYDGSLNLLGYTNPVAPGQQVQNLAFDIGGGNVLGIVSIDATTTADPNNGAKRVVFSIDGNNGQYDLSAVFWTVYTFGSGTFDAWLVTGGYLTTDNDPANLIFPADNNKSLGMPSTSMKVICVGSYVTKTQWVDIDGVTRIQGGSPTLNGISNFSSLGPTRDNRLKPDLTAPGEAIIAAMSGDLTIGPSGTPRTDILIGGKHKKFQGTSMASPHVTGSVALMLQRNSSLDYAQAVNILKTTARKDAFTGGSANNTYGNGKLNTLAAVQATTGGGTGTTTVLEQGFDGVSFPPGGWTQQILNSANTWIQGNPSASNFNTVDPTSTNSAICPWVAQNQDEWLKSSTFSLGSGSSSLVFYAGYSTNWLTFATLKLHISANGGTSWTQIWEAENDAGAWGWRQKTVSLSAYAGQQNLMLGWQYIGNDGDLVGLDGIKLTSTLTDVNDDVNSIPTDYSLAQNYPNPFNPSTTIKYSVPEVSQVKLILFDILGREVNVLVNKEQTPGNYTVQVNAESLSSGVYFYRIQAGKFADTKKMILMK